MIEAPGALPPGTSLGRYRVVRRIAVGGMAELYLARQIGVQGYEKVVAIKRILPHLSADADFVRMFLNEARVAARLSHAGIAQVIDFGSEHAEHFIAMEYVHGRSVQQLLHSAARRGGVPREVGLTILAEVAVALHYAHECVGPDGKAVGLVHRDVSPSNILVSFAGDTKLVDFGIAKATAHTRVTRSGGIKGKVAYMAPEQIRGHPVDRRADIFALSVVAYELLTGRRCFRAHGDFALINRVAQVRYTRPSALDSSFPEALEAIIVKGLSPDRRDRHDSALEFAAAIESAAEQLRVARSRLVVASWMDAVFGEQPSPGAEPLPTVRVEPHHAGLTTRAPARTAPRGRAARAPVVVAALVLGVGIGWGGPVMLADEDPPAPRAARQSPSRPPLAATQVPTRTPPPSLASDSGAPQPEPRPSLDRGSTGAPPESALASEWEPTAPSSASSAPAGPSQELSSSPEESSASGSPRSARSSPRGGTAKRRRARPNRTKAPRPGKASGTERSEASEIFLPSSMRKGSRAESAR